MPAFKSFDGKSIAENRKKTRCEGNVEMKRKKNLIIFTDSGDTIIDEATQKFDETGIVTEADFIENAGEVLEQLYGEGYRIALVADGEEASFRNVYIKNGLKKCFEGWTVSETVGVRKPPCLKMP